MQRHFHHGLISEQDLMGCVQMALIGPVIVGLALATAAGASAQPRDKAWIQQFMLTAEIVDAVPIGRGVTKPWRLTLSSGEITDDVAFNSVNK